MPSARRCASARSKRRCRPKPRSPTPAFAAAPPELRLRSHLALVHARFANGRLGDADAALADAAALAEAEGDALAPPLRALLLRGLANAARLRQDPARAEPLLREAARLLEGDAHLETRLQTLNLLAHVQHMGGRGDAAIATLEGCLAEAERAGLTVVLRSVLPNLVTLCADAAQAERGRAFLERGNGGAAPRRRRRDPRRAAVTPHGTEPDRR